MRKLSTLVLIAFLAVPSLCLAANGPSDAVPESHMIWIAAGSTPIAIEAAPEPELVTICYFGVTMRVRLKIAIRYLRVGATLGSCEDVEEEECPPGSINIGGECFSLEVGRSTLDKPSDTKDAIQLNAPQQANEPAASR